ncbi:MAG: hypothetical protein ACXAB7_08835 [Candidatus Kariarchaeaceae archaeon]|jgi:hypothetical protein
MSKTRDQKTLTHGLLVTVFEDDGPINIYNSTPLGDDEAFSMAIKTLTAIGTSTPFNQGEIRIYGPLPTPREPLKALALQFSLKAKDSRDGRIAQFGRMIIFWLITTSANITKYTEFLKLMIKRTLRLYNVKVDKDLYVENTLKKIDEKMQIVDTGIDAYYVDDNESIETVMSLSMVSESAPIILIDSYANLINILFRDESSPLKKAKIRNLINDFKTKLPKGTMYKVEMITDKITVNQLLTKSGLEVQSDIGVHYRVRLTDQLEFDELDEYISQILNQKRLELTKKLLTAFNNKESVSIVELSADSGFQSDFILKLLNSAISANILANTTIEGNMVIFK